ncbi:DUF2799 domain-containing protein [Suttonella sp. R2A3]|uniref:DUF2799 domain-containing protein n=1 Tax=Suttonella sp. R2A3 TaxID=2908648 RepID=UPI001F284157|nr:DUF2799 domain-containing protein [Suttonella sp. R2A3]UJF24873.1 DUF2799 domain-containing protein [Suttonella sp. R2A3]
MSYRQLGVAIAAVLTLVGCASMSVEECMVANWNEQGYKDGRNGYAPTRIIEHRKACAKAGMAPDAMRYRQGWDAGVLQYCTPANGVAQGRAGSPYRNVCPPQLEGDFVYWYQQGKAVYDAQRRVDDLNREVEQLQYQLHNESDDRVRRHLRRELEDTWYQLRRARDDLAWAERRSM